MKLVCEGGSGGFANQVYDLDRSPCPSIMANGIGGVRRSQYWILGGGSGPLHRNPSDKATPESDPQAFFGMTSKSPAR